ncbi:hypothetical protein KL86DPRO_10777 [uncultured delta proteobacterium]|uniref:Uncharacterized protein n=1 Tax=uncultured delta proteobacterium TaxID=34034 RepID=A0A212J644_9DELT|nr:hypothetical protein KL86DPRO_10777 [uncultured delta proteobacterium]
MSLFCKINAARLSGARQERRDARETMRSFEHYVAGTVNVNSGARRVGVFRFLITNRPGGIF